MRKVTDKNIYFFGFEKNSKHDGKTVRSMRSVDKQA